MTTKPLAAPLRIALIGQAGAGKTTHARLLQQKYRGDVLSFATPMKKMLRELFEERMDEPVFARDAAQQFGTDFVRRRDRNAWVRLLLKKVPDNRNTFVDDCRFYNEYLALQSIGFHFLRLYCDPAVLHERRPDMTVEQLFHESEQDIAILPCEYRTDTGLNSVEAVHHDLVSYIEARILPTLGQPETVEPADARPADEPVIFIEM